MAPSERRGILLCLTCEGLLASSQAQPKLGLDYLEILKGVLPFLNTKQLEELSGKCLN